MQKEQKITCTVIHPNILAKIDSSRTPEQRLEEAVGLALALDLDVVEKFTVNLKEITPSTFLGKGKVQEIKDLIKEKNIRLIIIDTHISPGQQKNLEKELQAKVIDRTALILEIFASRARTGEGKLQVELASLEYQRSRLVRTWTHLERQRGGFGMLSGPGETQLEIDKRLLGDKIIRIKKELEKVKKTRELHRKSRKSVPYPVVALVGYTNAGKSTLFNKLTGAEVVAEDKLFATLDPTMRVVILPSKKKIILSDTVGFISDLPTELVAAFRATLEEVVEADIILHVRDVSTENSEAEKHDVEKVLSSLGVTEKLENNGIEVMNKVDLLSMESRVEILENNQKNIVSISALNGEGLDDLLGLIDKKLNAGSREVHMKISSSDGKLLAWIYAHSENVKAENMDDKIDLKFNISEKNFSRMNKILSEK